MAEAQLELTERYREALAYAALNFYFAPGVVHQNANRGAAPAKTYVVFVAEKGKPLTVPAK